MMEFDRRQHGFPTIPLSYSKIEQIAMRARRALLSSLLHTERISGIDLFENLDELEIDLGGRKLPVDYAVNALPAGLEGLTLFDDERQEIVVVLSPDTYGSLLNGHPRALFCLCHELGHVCVHTRMLIELSRIPHHIAALHRGEVPRHQSFEDSEWQANSFAAAFMMPAVGLEELERYSKLLTPEIIKNQFDVSFYAARVRLDVFRSRRNDLLK